MKILKNEFLIFKTHVLQYVLNYMYADFKKHI